MIRKVLIALVLFLFLTVSPVLAGSGSTNLTAKNYSDTFLENLIVSLTTSIAGSYDANRNVIQPGAVTFFAQGIDTMISVRPASGIDFARYLSSKLHFPGTPAPAYAAATPGGIGYTSLEPLLVFWLVMRNIAYWFFSVAFVVAGLMIMFRFKIDPKTAATIQSTLPKIVFALLLVTFSYAIAGFLVDLMYVAIGLILAQVRNIDPTYAANFTDKIASHSIFSLWLGEAGATANGASLAVGQIVTEFIRGPLGEASGAIGGLIAGPIAWLIIMIAILWVLFKTWLMLLNAYANIILLVIFAPVMLMLDAIPGQNQFSGWLRNLLAYLLSFPAVIILIFIGAALSVSPTVAMSSTGFVPPLLGGNSQPAIQGIVGLAILLTIPKTVEALQQLLKTPENKLGSAWSEALGASYGAIRGAAGAGAGKAYEATGIPQQRAAYSKQKAEAAINPYNAATNRGVPPPTPPSGWKGKAVSWFT